MLNFPTENYSNLMKLAVILVSWVHIPDYFWYLNVYFSYTVDIVYNDLEGSIFCGDVSFTLVNVLLCAFFMETMFPWWDTLSPFKYSLYSFANVTHIHNLFSLYISTTSHSSKSLYDSSPSFSQLCTF